MVNNNHEYVYQEYLSLTHGLLKYLMAYNNHEYGTKSIYHQHMECLNTSWLTSNH